MGDLSQIHPPVTICNVTAVIRSRQSRAMQSCAPRPWVPSGRLHGPIVDTLGGPWSYPGASCHRATACPRRPAGCDGPASFRSYLRTRRDWLMELCRRCVESSGVDAEDIFAEAILRGWEFSTQKGAGAVSWDGWFFRVIYGLATDARKQTHRHARLAAGMRDSLDIGTGVPGVAVDHRTIEDRVIERQRAAKLISMAAGLPERLADAMALRVMHGLTYAEISSVLGISVVAARKRVQMARARLRHKASRSGLGSEAALD